MKFSQKLLIAGAFALSGTYAFATPNCDTLPNQASTLRAQLDTNGFAEVPAGVTWRVDELELKDSERLFGKGTICKSDDVTHSLHITGTDVKIEDLTFKPQVVSGQPNCDIKLGDGSKDVKIMSNSFVGQTYSAICGADDSSTGGEAYQTPSSGVLVTNNTFSGYTRPIYLHSVDNISIRNNVIRNSYRDAIRLRENDGYALITGNQFIEIGDNTPSTETQDAIDTMWGGNRLVITDNVVRKTESVGFDIKGVSPDTSSLGSRSIIIANNHISETRYSGMVLHGNLDTGEINHSIIIEGNIIEKATRNQTYADAAIWAKGAIKYLTIANNQLRSNYARGITIQTRSGLSDGTVSGVHVTGNTLINNGVASAPSSIGLFLLGVQGAIVTDNTVGNDPGLENPSTRFGIYASKVDDSIFKNNILRCNSSSQISVSGSNLINKDNLSLSTNCQ